jgi:hypothetical protein
MVDQLKYYIFTGFIGRPIKVLPFLLNSFADQSKRYLFTRFIRSPIRVLPFYPLYPQTNQNATFLPVLSVDQSECYLFTRFIHRPVKVHPFYSIFSCNIFSGAVVAVF